MKTKTMLVLGVFAACQAFAAERANVLLKADAMRVAGEVVTASGRASAIVKGGHEDMRMSAGQIAYDPATNRLECSGGVEIVANGRKIVAKELSVELGEQPARVTRLEGGRVILGTGEALNLQQTAPAR